MFSILLVPLVVAIFLAVNMGASGTAPSFSASYGANLLRRELIPGLFGTCVLLGAVIAGSKVVKTIGRDILPAENMTLAVVTIIFLSCAISLFFANYLRVPQSTSQSTVFALVGCALCLDALKTPRLLLEIIPTWLILPFICFAITYALGRFLYNPLASKFGMTFDTIRDFPIWRLITILCSCYVAFSIGSNNVANAAGPIASMIINELQLGDESVHPVVLLVSTLLIAPWFGIGSSFLGGRVLETTGKGIIDLGPMSATLIAFVTATLLLCASLTRGIPTSLVQLNTAAILAVGVLKQGPQEIFVKSSTIRLFIIWIIAPLISFGLSVLLTAIYVQMVP